MTPESDVLTDLLARVAALEKSSRQDAGLLERVPETVDELEAMSPVQQAASRAIMKCFEQIEDQLARIFRLIPKLLRVDTSGWYMRDYANFMEKAGVAATANEWMTIVDLRNRLVHDYPIDAPTQLAKLRDVDRLLPVLHATHARLLAFTRTRSELS